MRRLFRLLVGIAPLLVLAVAAFSAKGDVLDVGDPGSNNRFPFGYDSSQTTNYHGGAQYQQLFSAQDFTEGAIDITSIAFATSSSNSNVVAASYSLDVHLGIAATSAHSPSTTFAANRGASYQDVYAGAYSFVPQNNDVFDFILNLQAPYVYDPSQGDLLFNVSLTTNPVFAGTALYFDGDISDTDSRVCNAAAGAATGFSNAFTLYTEFTYTPEETTSATPEPATAGLLGAVGIWFWMGTRRRA